MARTSTWLNIPIIGRRAGSASPATLLTATGSASMLSSRSNARSRAVFALQSPKRRDHVVPTSAGTIRASFMPRYTYRIWSCTRRNAASMRPRALGAAARMRATSVCSGDVRDNLDARSNSGNRSLEISPHDVWPLICNSRMAANLAGAPTGCTSGSSLSRVVETSMASPTRLSCRPSRNEARQVNL